MADLDNASTTSSTTSSYKNFLSFVSGVSDASVIRKKSSNNASVTIKKSVTIPKAVEMEDVKLSQQQDNNVADETMSYASESDEFDGGYKERERWSSRAAFYFAAVGSAVGFGNIWRFPALVFEYGGAVFFIPYIAAVLLIGLPILVLEISLGQYYETGDVDVFGGIHKRLRGVGLLSVACGYMVVTYYSMLISWVSHAFFDSFGTNIWTTHGVTGSDAKSYFYDNIIGMETLGDDSKPTRIVWANVGYSFLTWVLVYLCVAFGVKWTGRISFVTMGLPLILLLVMLGRAVTLEGAKEGIANYLSLDWNVLVDRPEVWVKAVSQVFFSLSITFGIMTAYGSHCNRDEPAFKNATVIAVSDSLFSFTSGFAVFAMLGNLALMEGLEIKDLEYSGFGLVFGSFPVALGCTPGGAHWVRAFFVLLFTLGLDSAYSFMDGFLICLSDTVFLGHVDKKYTALGLTVVAWLLSFIYATDAGLLFLDTVDYYINFVMLLVGGAECFSAGWIYNIEEQVDNLGASIVFSYMATTFGSVFLACIIWFSINDNSTALWAGFLGLVLCYTAGMIFVVCLMKKKKQEEGLWTWRSMFYDLMFRNMMDLRDDLSGVVGFMPVAWAVLVKYFIPPVMIILFALGASTKNSTGQTQFGHYSGYPFAPYQILGISGVVFAGFLFFSSLIMPQLYSAFQKNDSPVPSKDATISAAPKQVGVENYGITSFSLNSSADANVWPPRSISAYHPRTA